MFLARDLPLPSVQIETNTISLLPPLIGQTRLLSFLARNTLEDVRGAMHLREVPLKETTMKRTLVAAVREGGYLSPAAQSLLDLLKREGRSYFVER